MPNLESFVKNMQDKQWPVRLDVAKALGKIGDARAVEPLTELLTDKDWDVRCRAEEALEKLKTP